MRRSDATLILGGSARGDGDTAAAVEMLVALLPQAVRVIDLCEAALRRFAYAEVMADDDDFRSIVAAMAGAPRILLATPVYWYAMSGVMKNFFDRLTDLLLDPVARPMGRALAGRELWLLAVGTDPELPEGFEVPFRRTADYFAMRWGGACYLRAGKRGGLVDPHGPLTRLAAALGQ